jgi:hypothetical protein
MEGRLWKGAGARREAVRPAGPATLRTPFSKTVPKGSDARAEAPCSSFPGTTQASSACLGPEPLLLSTLTFHRVFGTQ